MKSNCKLLFGLLAISVFFAACKSADKSAESRTEKTWTAGMQRLSASLANLLPLAHDPLQFNDPSNREIINQEVSRLAQFSHDLIPNSDKKLGDPAIDYVASRFSADMQEAKRQLSIGNPTYSRYIIRNATNYCISCHTQSDRGPKFQMMESENFTSKLGPLDRTNYLIAIRRFDEAVSEFEKAMNSPDVALQPFPSLESVTLKILAVAVRVKKDPKMAERIVNRMVQSKWAPVYLQMSGTKWRDSIQEWSRAPKKMLSLMDAKKLISLAGKRQMESPMSRAGLIEYLQASAALHDLLDKTKPGKEYADALYYAGIASEALKELDLLDTSERYFEACIRHLPQTPQARNCYIRLEAMQIASYSETESGRLPQAVRDNLDALKKLAETKGQPWLDPNPKAE